MKQMQNITPIFTGDYKRDTVVSDSEKVAEISQTIYRVLTKKQKERK